MKTKMSSWADKRSAEEKSYAKYEDNKEYIEKKRKSFQEEVKNKIVSEAKVRESKAEVKALKKTTTRRGDKTNDVRTRKERGEKNNGDPRGKASQNHKKN